MANINASLDKRIGRRDTLEDDARHEALSTPTGFNLHISVVCDGVGGGELGQTAARVALDTVFASFSRSTRATVPEMIYEAIVRANRAVYETMQGLLRQQPSPNSKPSTTLVMAVVHLNDPTAQPHGRLYIGNIGDSQVHLVRAGRMVRLNTDHTRGNEMYIKEQISREEIPTIPHSDALSRAVGILPDVDPDLGLYALRGRDFVPYDLANQVGVKGLKLEEADTLVLGSDGLFKDSPVDKLPIAAENLIVKHALYKTPALAVQAVMDVAQTREPDDNFTLIYTFITPDSPKRKDPRRRLPVGLLAAIFVLIAGLGLFAFLQTRQGEVVTEERDLLAAQASETADQIIRLTELALSATPTPTDTATPTPTPLPTATYTPQPTPVPQIAANDAALRFDGRGNAQTLREEERYTEVDNAFISFDIDNASSVDDGSGLVVFPGSALTFDRVDAGRGELEFNALPNTDMLVLTGGFIAGEVRVGFGSIAPVTRVELKVPCAAVRYVSPTTIALACYSEEGSQCRYTFNQIDWQNAQPSSVTVLDLLQNTVLDTLFIDGEPTSPAFGDTKRYYEQFISLTQNRDPVQCLQPYIDDDRDGALNDVDQCRGSSGPPGDNGCPDTDGDGFHDGVDRCIEVRGVAPNGCPPPDTDRDGVIDSRDACPTEPGPRQDSGCPDSDGDGLPNNVDACDTQPGPARNDGCPLPDRDGDGVPDESDRCPDRPGPFERDGCPVY